MFLFILHYITYYPQQNYSIAGFSFPKQRENVQNKTQIMQFVLLIEDGNQIPNEL